MPRDQRIISHCHLGPSLYRFAVKHKELFRTTALMVELWKHCLNHIQFRTIDTEVLRVVMEVVKGGKEEWSSVGKSQWGIGLAGPVVLDERAPSPPTSPVPRRRVGRPSGRHVEEKKRTEVEETPQKKSQKPTEDPGEGHGICTCGNGWARDDMVRCDGVVRIPSPLLLAVID